MAHDQAPPPANVCPECGEDTDELEATIQGKMCSACADIFRFVTDEDDDTI